MYRNDQASVSNSAKDEETPIEDFKDADPNKASVSNSAKDEETPIEDFKDADPNKEQPDEIPENIRKATEQADDLEVTFWDFAGQELYYSTHQVFFNRRAVFALVFDMSKKLEERCEVQDFSKKRQSRFHDFNGEDFIKFWLQSIYTYAAQDSADDKGYPPIFIIGTHKRDSAVEEEVVKDQLFAILEGKQYEKYVRRQFHFLENDPTKQQQPCDEEALKSMKDAVAKAAINAPHMKEQYPIKWLQFHKAVIETLGTGDNKPYITLEETRELAAECNITDESQFITMLGLYHDLGTIIWFGEDKILKNTIILDPQWLIDVFKAVITVLPNEQQASHASSHFR
ncbi:probable serine/threonine-protein kinase pats1 [Amphiura filiformis]|uniref:probable serine/threonine-protein kinase pats1 n=1 Tax=Amphiura filiformis TaxID=82378 RepID=UPI003B227CC4